jgi:glycine oxidase
MSRHPDILIVGGGVIGLTCAVYLVRRGATVKLLDMGDLGQKASWAGAGILPPANPAFATTRFEQLRALSISLFPTLSQQLRERTGIDNGYVVCGGFEFPDPEAVARTDEWRTEGIAFEELHGAELHRRQPWLASNLQHATWLPEAAQVRNPRHLKALIAYCQARDVRLEPRCMAHSLVHAGNRILGVEADHGRVEAGRTLLASGAWTDGLLASVGWQPGIRPVRGQMALLNRGPAGVRPLLLQGKRYLVPRTDGLILVGSTVEDAGFVALPTAGGIAGLLTFAASLVPELAEATVERCWAGLRPGSPDGLPFLGPVPGCEGLYVASGHFRSGIQLSPATGKLMADMLLDRPLRMPLDAFRLDRPLMGQAAFRS